jgi:hypothetical protein
MKDRKKIKDSHDTKEIIMTDRSEGDCLEMMAYKLTNGINTAQKGEHRGTI